MKSIKDIIGKKLGYYDSWHSSYLEMEITDIQAKDSFFYIVGIIHNQWQNKDFPQSISIKPNNLLELVLKGETKENQEIDHCNVFISYKIYE